MEKIQCPHCGAINQDVTPRDKCWQCNKVLGASLAAATEAGAEGADGATVYKQEEKPKAPTRLDEIRARDATNPRKGLPVGVIVLVALLLIVLIAVVVILLNGKR